MATTDRKPSSAKVMVEARGLEKNYALTRAVRGLSFKVKRGEIVGFLGPNGAGKSTTMKMLTGYIAPTSGQALIAGVDVSVDPLAAQRHIGYLPESAPMYEDMLVIDFLRYIADLRQVPRDVLSKRLKGICERCGLTDVLGKDIGHLSKGFRQRVGIAQAMVHDPDLLILDEPTSGLDPNQIIEIRHLIKELGKDKTVLLSTHIMQEVEATCDRVLIIDQGELVADNTPKGLTEEEEQEGALIHLVVTAKNGAPLAGDKIRSVLDDLPGITSVDSGAGEGEGTLGFRLRAKADDDPRAAVFDAAVNNEFVLLAMHRERLTLEETFRRRTGTKTQGK